MTLEDDLRNALQHKADGVEPGPESYVKLAAQVDSTSPVSHQLGDRARFLAVAAALVLAVGGLTVYASQSADDNTSIAAGTVTTEQMPTTTVANQPETQLGDPVVETTEAPPLTGFVAGPVEATRDAAAEEFLRMIGRDWAAINVVDNVAEISSSNEDGSVGPVVSYLHLARVDSKNGYAVTHATAEDVVIGAPTPPESATYNTITTNESWVYGDGTGFEGSLGVEAISSIDGTLLFTGGTAAGNFGELAPYEETVYLYGSGRAWIVVSSGGGADNVTEPFAAVPVSYDTPVHPTIYSVTGIADDDPDGGLNVRNLPGNSSSSAASPSESSETQEGGAGESEPGNSESPSESGVPDAEASDPNDAVAVLPMGTTDIHIRSIVPAMVGDEVWWNIEVGEIEGWVNSRYLVDIDAQHQADLEQIARDFEQAILDGGPGLDALPWATEGTIQVGYVLNLIEATPDEVATVDFWFSGRDNILGVDSTSGLVQDGPSPLNGLIKPFPGEPTDVVFETRSPYEPDRQVLEALAEGQEVVTLVNSSDDVAFNNVHLYLEDSADGPVIVAIAVVIWTP